jgi:glutamate-5-semialdehyde dehydrogenase
MQAEASTSHNIAALMDSLGRAAVDASRALARATTATKNAALTAAAAEIRKQRTAILEANRSDLQAARERALSDAMMDRLALDEQRVAAMAKGIEEVAALNDPIGVVIAAWTRPNGLRIERVRVPLGVVGIIYESRPNVTADAGALCLKSGNAVILRGGSESANSSRAIHACLVAGLRAAGLPEAAIQIVPTTDRAAVGHMLSSMTDSIDVVVPRGGRSLVERVQKEARVPVIGHLEGNCHVYVDRDADAGMAREIVLNAKLRRTGVCGAAETVLFDRGGTGAKSIKP